jgi:hypothetical protein
MDQHENKTSRLADKIMLGYYSNMLIIMEILASGVMVCFLQSIWAIIKESSTRIKNMLNICWCIYYLWGYIGKIRRLRGIIND